MGFAKPIEQYLFGNLLTKMHVFMYLKDIIRGADKMLVTGIIVLGVAVYAVWAVRKIRKDRKNGACCGGSCSGCVGKEYCSK